ncbi:hypothetical protein GO986_18020 [Deinococcus sp. HMF7620]|uniref:HK97 gp10 family phage protein n=1 Tax=Deinococcus arboris TaxID=2682977 RepID=A0A7C9LQK8_9DEIO|nr:hypothetical protein [Deinococcus arboris]MVN88636.1 hypothetical protein [Deinococcus arboris]
MLRLTASLDLYGNPTLRRRLERLGEVPVEVARELAKQTAVVLTREAKANLQFQSARTLGRRSGNLITHTRAFARDTPNGATVELYTLFYGRVNARGMEIEAKNVPYLVFRIGNRFFRKRSVIIPARDWDRLAIERTRAQIPRLTRQAVTARMRIAP